MRYLKDAYIRFVLVLTLIILSGMFAVYRHNSKGPQSAESAIRFAGEFVVKKVIDGDTLILSSGDTVRLIGVDTPELHHPEVPVQRFASEAMEFSRKFAEGFVCRVEVEGSDNRDKYGRLLAYIRINGRLLNSELIRLGYGYAYRRFAFEKSEEFARLEAAARKSGYGLWNTSLRDGRIANIIASYESLNLEGKEKFDTELA